MTIIIWGKIPKEGCNFNSAIKCTWNISEKNGDFASNKFVSEQLQRIENVVWTEQGTESLA